MYRPHCLRCQSHPFRAESLGLHHRLASRLCTFLARVRRRTAPSHLPFPRFRHSPHLLTWDPSSGKSSNRSRTLRALSMPLHALELPTMAMSPQPPRIVSGFIRLSILQGSFSWNLLATIEKSCMINAITWRDLGNRLVGAGINVVLWIYNKSSWQVSWRSRQRVPQYTLVSANSHTKRLVGTVPQAAWKNSNVPLQAAMCMSKSRIRIQASSS